MWAGAELDQYAQGGLDAVMSRERDRLRAENRYLTRENERLFNRVKRTETDCKALEKALFALRKRIVILNGTTSVSCAMLLSQKDSKNFAKFIEKNLAMEIAEELFARGAVGLVRKDVPETNLVEYKARLEVLMPEKKVTSWLE